MLNRKLILAAALGVATLGLSACATLSRGPVGNSVVPQPAKPVELARYLGLWYEFARYENGFEKDCEAVTATYSQRDDGKIGVRNACRKGSIDGAEKIANGKAKIVPDSGGAKLKVSFFGPFYGEYWVLDHADDYSWSIVGEPSGRYLWILTRAGRPDAGQAAALIRRAGQLGYDEKLIRLTKQK
jgi:apolipoprotein D and lipocalin family protein